MKFSEHWLRQWINPACDTQALAEKMAMLGLTVDAVIPVAGKFTGVLVGEVVACTKHPNAEKLSCCEVNIGASQLLKIVCGAPNARAGIKVAVATVGAVLPGDFRIKEAKLRGEVSQGMLCSEKELQLELGKSAQEGIIELPSDAPVGKDFREYFHADDHIIDVDITPNRGDALSILGLVRDLSAGLEIPLTMTPIDNCIDYTKKDPSSRGGSPRDPGACPRFITRIIRNVNNTVQTPSAIQQALQRANIRTINPIVDITNYVMLELGQPMHAYDLAKIKGELDARFAKKTTEKLQLLDEQVITLTSEDLVVADEEKPLALAGIMGGMASGVSSETKDIILEAAFFNPKNICLSKRRHNTSSESSHRFERGVDFANTDRAMLRATQLMVEIVGGRAEAMIDRISEADLPKRESIFLARAQIKRMLGIEIDDKKVSSILNALEMQVEKTDNGWQVTPPSFRFDMTLPIDIIEELARMMGYEHIPAAPMSAVLKMHSTTHNHQSIRQFLVDRNFHEAISYSFISTELHALFSDEKPLRLSNPISQEMSVMRTSLLPGLLCATQINLNNGSPRVHLFEIGKCFFGDTEKTKLAVVMTGSIAPEQWAEKTRSGDFYDLKDTLFSFFPLTADRLDANTVFHPSRACRLMRAGRSVGEMGEIHPALLQKIGIQQPVVACEMVLDNLDQVATPFFHFFSRFPAVRRDLAFILDENISYDQILNKMTQKSGEFLRDLRVFDVYQGDNIPAGKKSMAVGLTFQHSERTLRDEEINEIIQSVIATLAHDFQATLRT
ncbi:MAG: phenylalanine--tRNA ligase subunit beta [Gammaproteobacteria bacterium RIFCSPHIGHO2_12_FULL_42_13]|nr:MAG: phenylalanine--tRNA ligase subunit beta [Gammaproteobacteria bacterium RIFCSPHIGHO2_12_FULL_42_13]